MLIRLIISGCLLCTCCANYETHSPARAAIDTGLSSPAQAKAQWKAAIFKGIEMGISKREKALAILGQPIHSEEVKGTVAEEDEIWDEYLNIDNYGGRLVIASSKRTALVANVIWYPTDLDLEGIKKMFGGDYQFTRYDFVVNCPKYKDSDSQPIYETPDGNLGFIEYRSQGVAIFLDYTSHEIEDVQFVSEPIGLSSPRCE